MTPRKIEVSYKTIVFTVFFLLLLVILYQVRQVLIIFFVGLILMAAVNPLVEKLERLKIPRIVSTLLIYALFLAILGLALIIIIPPLVMQTAELLSGLGKDDGILGQLGVDQGIWQGQISNLLSNLGSISGGLLKFIGDVFGNTLVFFAIIVVSVYLVLERKNLDKHLARFFGKEAEEKIEAIIVKIERRIGGWVRAQLILMLTIGLLTFVGLSLLRIEFALPLAILSGILEVIPNVGPTLSAVPAIIAGLTISPLMGLATGALYLLVQQLENQLIVPQVMAKEVGINPLITILGLFAGYNLAGIGGAFLAIPVIILIEVIVGEFWASRQIEKSS